MSSVPQTNTSKPDKTGTEGSVHHISWASFLRKAQKATKSKISGEVIQGAFPVEIIFPIITEALRPRLIIDHYSTLENMAEVHHVLTSPNKTFHNIVQKVSEKNDIGKSWLYQADNDPRKYRAPSLKWAERDGNDSVKGLRRFDLEMEFEHSQQLHVIYPWPQISVFSLTVQRGT
ncbi:615_t:CDS:2, partial [Acaulospora colombiana]